MPTSDTAAPYLLHLILDFSSRLPGNGFTNGNMINAIDVADIRDVPDPGPESDHPAATPERTEVHLQLMRTDINQIGAPPNGDYEIVMDAKPMDKNRTRIEIFGMVQAAIVSREAGYRE